MLNHILTTDQMTWMWHYDSIFPRSFGLFIILSQIKTNRDGNTSWEYHNKLFFREFRNVSFCVSILFDILCVIFHEWINMKLKLFFDKNTFSVYVGAHFGENACNKIDYAVWKRLMWLLIGMISRKPKFQKFIHRWMI